MRWFALDQFQQHIGYSGIELLPGFLLKLGDDLRHGQRLAVGAVGGHGVQGIAGVDDARLDRNLLSFEAVRVSRAIPSLVLGPNDRAQRGKERNGGEDAFADHRVLAHDGKFLRRQRPGLLQDVAGDADLADVVEQGSVLEQAQLVGGQVESLPHVDRELGGFPRVRLGVAVFCIQGGRQGADGGDVTLLLLAAAGLVLVEQREPDAR